ncbi:MAG: tetratricopeptide repeat-containing protein [Rhodobacteraceae bacterium]|nr:tetratricopeptide repeat-containing protein [Paracoccaceae bacterium]
MNTFEPLIWGFKPDTEMRVALEAGWRRSDVIWERVMERALEAWSDSPRKPARARARRLFRQADILARICFDAKDPRRATVAANLAVVHRASGEQERAVRQQCRALQIWKDVPRAIDDMQVLPRSRSSLFHLRMEALHRDTYHSNLRTRISRIAAETEETLRTLTNGQPTPHRHASRWRGERPTVYDGTRKVLGACLLILDE